MVKRLKRYIYTKKQIQAKQEKETTKKPASHTCESSI
jgi:hypothetical protein